MNYIVNNSNKNYTTYPTIFALSSASGKSGVSVYRISGSKSYDSIKILTKNNNLQVKHKMAQLVNLYDIKTNNLIDKALIIYFKSPNSFTGEDIIEIHTHGSQAIYQMLFDNLSQIDGLRHAENGEFTKRAFYNKKIGLTQAEGLIDIINSETIMQHKQAINQFSGNLENLYLSYRNDLLKASAFIETLIDYPDEDIPKTVTDNLSKIISDIKSSIKEHINDNRKGEILSQGINLSIIGKPNSGKSSLINFITQKQTSIVSGISGTTRDIVTANINIGNYPFKINDTAGFNNKSKNHIELEGIKRAKQLAKISDIKILMFSCEYLLKNSLKIKNNNSNNKYDKDEIVVSSLNDLTDDTEIIKLIDNQTIIILNKIDLLKTKKITIKDSITLKDSNIITTSLITNEGTELVLKKIISIAEILAKPTNSPIITRERYRNALKRGLISLENISLNKDMELVAEDLRIACQELSMLTGNIDTEDILGEIFSNFCIGK